MTGQNLHLWVKGPDRPGQGLVGELSFQRIDPSPSEAGLLQLYLDFNPFPDFLSIGQSKWLALQGAIWDQKVPPRTCGNLEIPHEAWPTMRPTGQSGLTWLWRLLPEDMEKIESRRDSQAANFRVRVTGLLQLPNVLFPVEGEGYFQVPVSEWLMLLTRLGYATPPSVASLVGAAVLESAAWRRAEQNLSSARRHLAAGEDRQAMTNCLDQFSALVTAPYNAPSWLAVLSDDPPQKKESFAAMLAGFCTYLNRVGYHRERSSATPGNQLVPMPLDHWEAESAVATAQIMLTMAIRTLARKAQ